VIQNHALAGRKRPLEPRKGTDAEGTTGFRATGYTVSKYIVYIFANGDYVGVTLILLVGTVWVTGQCFTGQSA
jgi:hypothetical protein